MMRHVPTAKYLLDEFLEKYFEIISKSLDFEITGGHHLVTVESFGLDVEQSKSKISLRLDAYIRETPDTRRIWQRRRSDQISDQSPHRCSRDMGLGQRMYRKHQKRSDTHSILQG